MAIFSNGNEADQLQAGSRAQRPGNIGSSEVGYTRFNTDTNNLEVWTGSNWTVPLDIQDGDFDNNIITWRETGEITSWTTNAEGPASGAGGPRGVFADRPVYSRRTNNPGTGATVSCSYSKVEGSGVSTLTDFIVNNPGQGYKNGETVDIQLTDTVTIEATITVAEENVEPGWAARPGTEYFVSGRVNGNYWAQPTFNSGAVFGVGNGVGLRGEDFTEAEIQDASLRVKPVGVKQSLVNIFQSGGGNVQFRCKSAADDDKQVVSIEAFGMSLDPDEAVYDGPRSIISAGYVGGDGAGKNDGEGKIVLSTTKEYTDDITQNLVIENGNIFLTPTTSNNVGVEPFAVKGGGIFSTQIATTTGAGDPVLIDTTGGKMKTSTSSRRYKNNIKDSTLSGAEALGLVNKMQVRTWNDWDSGSANEGFIAEELFELAGERFVSFAPWSYTTEDVVSVDKETGEKQTKTRVVYPRIGNGETPVTRDGKELNDASQVVNGINQLGITVALLKSIQELSARLEALES